LTKAERPLNPVYWPVALRGLTDVVDDLVSETLTNWNSRLERAQLREALPQVAVLIALGLLFVVRGPLWSIRMGAYFRTFGGRGSGVWGFLISLGRIGLPLIGVYLICEGLSASRILGLRSTLILQAIPLWSATVLGFLWLGERVYPRRDEDLIFEMSASGRAAARRNLLLLSVALVLQDAVNLFEQIQNISNASRAVVGLPVIVLGAGGLLMLRRILRAEEVQRIADPDQTVERSGLQRIGPVLRRVALVVATAAPVLAAAGYVPLAEAILFPFILTIAVFGLVVILQDFFTALYAWLTRKGEAARESVFPALFGFVLILCALPVLALIWGARVTDLTELWQTFLQGVSVGDTRISPVDFLTFAVVFVLGLMLTRLLQGALRNNLLPKTRLDPGGRTAMVSGTGYIGVFLAALVAASMDGSEPSSLAIVGGALSDGNGLGQPAPR